MPCLSGRCNLSIGPILNIGVARSGSVTPASAATGIQVSIFPALIDTGATLTCVSPQVVQAVGLHPSGKRDMVSATQSAPMNVYLVDLVLPFGTAGLHMPDVQVMEFAGSPNNPFQMLLGRDILGRGTFTLSFDGHFTFSL
jgi:hypothetical protein